MSKSRRHRSVISTVTPNNSLRNRSFSKTFFTPEEVENAGVSEKRKKKKQKTKTMNSRSLCGSPARGLYTSQQGREFGIPDLARGIHFRDFS